MKGVRKVYMGLRKNNTVPTHLLAMPSTITGGLSWLAGLGQDTLPSLVRCVGYLIYGLKTIQTVSLHPCSALSLAPRGPIAKTGLAHTPYAYTTVVASFVEVLGMSAGIRIIHRRRDCCICVRGACAVSTWGEAIRSALSARSELHTLIAGVEEAEGSEVEESGRWNMPEYSRWAGATRFTKSEANSSTLKQSTADPETIPKEYTQTASSKTEMTVALAYILDVSPKIAPVVEATTIASPVGALDLTVHLDSESDPSEDPSSSDHPLEDSSKEDTLEPYKAIIARWIATVASRSSSSASTPPTSLQIAPALPR
ncbi:hypothetical protein Tco_0783053 [Tanacetum coccineum]